jgi:branched-chain amino acid aminotransferase
MSAGFSDQFFFQNNELVNCNLHSESNKSEISVYEVIKVIQGIPLFIEDHLERLRLSMELSNINYPSLSIQSIQNQIKMLCSVNEKPFGNIELRISKNPTELANMYLGFIVHSYPIESDYQNGIKVGLFLAERTLPNAKVKDTTTRINANKYIDQNKLKETLLHNTDGFITEGSRSNVFFIKGNQVFTAPSELVLKGISRKYVMKVLEVLNIVGIEKAIHMDDLSNMDAGFICGTSPGVLPINSIEDIKLNAGNALMINIMQAFNAQVEAYIQSTSFRG